MDYSVLYGGMSRSLTSSQIQNHEYATWTLLSLPYKLIDFAASLIAHVQDQPRSSFPHFATTTMQRLYLCLFILFSPLWAHPYESVEGAVAPIEYFDISPAEAVKLGILDEKDAVLQQAGKNLEKRDLVTLTGKAYATCPYLNSVETDFTVGAQVVDDTFKILRGKTRLCGSLPFCGYTSGY
jgi:hypothetical protein